MRKFFKPIRWSGENDRYFGPFTYARASKDEHSIRWSLGLSSGDGDDYAGCRLRATVPGHTLILALPQWVLRPYRVWVDCSKLQTYDSEGKPNPLRPDAGYWDQHDREYGLSLSGGHLSLNYGPQTNESWTSKHKGYLLPWMQQRMTRHSYYDESLRWVWDEPQGYRYGSPEMDAIKDVRETMPVVKFMLLDYDHTPVVATTRIEEREWRHGTGRFEWLSRFYKPLVIRRLNIEFSEETGRRKGSWKGGTLGTNGPIIDADTTHETAMQVYCVENEMTFVGRVD